MGTNKEKGWVQDGALDVRVMIETRTMLLHRDTHKSQCFLSHLPPVWPKVKGTWTAGNAPNFPVERSPRIFYFRLTQLARISSRNLPQ